MTDAKVPAIQKKMLKMAKIAAKPIITATQMFESMIHEVVPTRAEVADLAVAICDGTDAVMLSAETAVGDHPPLVIETVNRVCLGVEESIDVEASNPVLEAVLHKTDHAIAKAGMYIASHVDIDSVVTLTESGSTALWLSRMHLKVPIVAVSCNKSTCNRMTLYAGVDPVFDYRRVLCKRSCNI